MHANKLAGGTQHIDGAHMAPSASGPVRLLVLLQVLLQPMLAVLPLLLLLLLVVVVLVVTLRRSRVSNVCLGLLACVCTLVGRAEFNC